LGRDTGVQWADDSCNPVMGCDGCELWSRNPRGRRTCYAGVLHRRYSGGRSNKGYARDFLVPELFPGRVLEALKAKDLRGTARPEKPWLDGYPRSIFLSDMGDALSKGVPLEYLAGEVVDQVRSAARGGRRHVWLWLTKRPSRFLELFDFIKSRPDPTGQVDAGEVFPANVVAMTSVTGPRTVARLEALWELKTLQRRAGGPEIRIGVSFEPIGELDPLKVSGPVPWDELVEGLDWAILGGESEQDSGSGRALELHAAELERALAACARHGVPAFVKQLGSRFVGLNVLGRVMAPMAGHARLADHHGGKWDEWREKGLERFCVRRMYRPPVGFEPVEVAA
jgi:protein gp37